MAVATTLTRRTSTFCTRTEVYEVALCLCAQERNAAREKSAQRCCWRSRRIWACLGSFARRWRLYIACAGDKEGWGSSGYVYLR